MTCHDFLAPEKNKKSIQTFFRKAWKSLRMDSHIFIAFLPILGEKTRDGPTFSEANFGARKNYRLIPLNKCCLVHKIKKINTCSNK